MKIRFLTAIIAVIFMLFAAGPVARAEPLDNDPPEIPVVETPAPETPIPSPPETPAPEPTTPDPFAPGGTGTVIDYTDDGIGKVFYTIMTPDEHVFYLVIDRERSAENVYFLNAVTVDDLAALAVPSENKGPGGSTSGIPETPTITPTPEPSPTPEPEPSPAPQQSGGGMGTPILVIVCVMIGGGAGWYFKIYRPKQQRAASAEAEFEPPGDEEAPGSGEWDEEQWSDDDSGGGDEQ